MGSFFSTIPFEDYFENINDCEKDIQRIKELCPPEMRDVLKAVENRCDELECEGSRIFDEEPDRQMLIQEADRIAEKFLAQQSRDCMFCTLVRIIFSSEVFRRRCRFRRYRRFW